MIIESISMKNFQCYYGDLDRNVIKFKEGLNIIIGDNGAGKSKIFDAFYWVLYDQVFSTDYREFVYTNSFKEKLVSEKAMHECDIGNKVEVEVVLLAKTSTDTEYKLSRSYSIRKIAEREWEPDSASRMMISEKKIVKWDLVPTANHASVMRRVIPDHLKPYMWFQGEQVDSLMDFRDKATLTKAINLLSNIDTYDDLIAISKRGQEKAARNYRSAQNKASKDKARSEQLNNKRTKLEKEISKLTYTIEYNQEQLELAKDKIEDLIGRVDEAGERIKLKEQKEMLEKSIVADTNQLDAKYNGLHKKIFTDAWILKYAWPLFEDYSNKYHHYFTEHSKVLAAAQSQEVKLPINIPQPIHVNQMLKEEKCFVCGRDAHKGTPEYDYIQKLLGRKEAEKKQGLFKNDCSKFFLKLYDNALGHKQLIGNIDENIATEFSSIQTLMESIDDKKSKIANINNQFEGLLESDDSENIVNAFRTHEANRDKFQAMINSDEKQLTDVRSELSKVLSEIEKLVEGDVDAAAKLANEIFNDLVAIAESSRKNVFHDLIVELEDQANEIFKGMSEHNEAIKGKIKLKRISTGSYIPEIVDANGYIMHNPNDSNLVLVKLSLIMSIILSRGKRADNYAIILDAPTSKMAGNYTNGFYTVLSEKFTQSIVATYDFLSESERSQLDDFNLGNVYLLQPSTPGGNADDRSDLHVNIVGIT